MNKKKDKLLEERIKKLELLDGWKWDKDEKWNETYEQVKNFLNTNNKFPSECSKDKNVKSLGYWIMTQKRNKKKDKLLEERIEKLELLDGWKWSKDGNISPNSIKEETPKSRSPRINCDRCKKEFTERTLKKYGGICGKCDKERNSSKMEIGEIKKAKEEIGLKEKEKSKMRCNKCKKEFTERTLKKYGGICGKCNNNGTEEETSKTKSPKMGCNGCKREFTERTLKKYGGICGKCNNKKGE